MSGRPGSRVLVIGSGQGVFMRWNHVAAALFSAMTAIAWPATADTLQGKKLDVVGSFKDDRGKDANDLSGVACAPAVPRSPRLCVIINDQDKSAQVATLMDGQLKPGPRLRLLGDAPAPDIIGQKPTGLACSGGEAAFGDLDGEAVAYAAPYFYVVGSHGCSRKNARYSPSAFILARFRLDAAGHLVGANGRAGPASDGAVATTFRLAEALRNADDVGGFFGKDLNGQNGLNVEGLAIDGPVLYAGLRAPSRAGQAYLVGVPVEDLFSAGTTPLKGAVTALSLGNNVGIRDLTPLRNGSFLVLSGPAQEQANVPYAVHLVDLLQPRKATLLATLSAATQGNDVGKAEAIFLLESSGQVGRLLVMFDSLKNGGPREYKLPLR